MPISHPARCAAFDLRSLAREREARVNAMQVQPSSAPISPHVSAGPSLVSLTDGGTSRLLIAHRSIRLARALGLIILFFSLLSFFLFGMETWVILFYLASFLIARFGAPILHSSLPLMLVEGTPPQPSHADTVAGCGLFSLALFNSPLAAFDAEWTSFVESSAFVATYGKKNCLTDKIYGGPELLSLRKVLSAVVGKLREGRVSC